MEIAGGNGRTAVETKVGAWLEPVEQQVLEQAQIAQAAIGAFLTRQIEAEELGVRLRLTGAMDLLVANWHLLISTPAAAPALEILQLIAFLPDQVAFQVERYGANSLVEDREQLVSGLRRLEAKRKESN